MGTAPVCGILCSGEAPHVVWHVPDGKPRLVDDARATVGLVQQSHVGARCTLSASEEQTCQSLHEVDKAFLTPGVPEARRSENHLPAPRRERQYGRSVSLQG